MFPAENSAATANDSLVMRQIPGFINFAIEQSIIIFCELTYFATLVFESAITGAAGNTPLLPSLPI